MKVILAHSYNSVPYYKDIFDKRGYSLSEFSTFEDLNRLPVIRKTDVYERYDTFMSKNYKVYKPLGRTTGGTTGLAFKFYNDTNSWGLNWATKIRTFSWGGYKYGEDRVAVMAGGS